MSTVALNMIVKDEYEAVARILANADKYFDEINITVSDKPTANKIKKFVMLNADFHVKWREWNNRFDDARNANLAMCTTDYMFWIDADDWFDFSTIPELVSIADENNIDAIFLPYNYAQDERGNCVTRHYRERLLRTNVGYESRGWVHETFITDEPHVEHKMDSPEVIHRTSQDHAIESSARNHDILEAAYAETKDPRYLHYLGMSYYTKADYKKAAELLSNYLEVGGSLEDTYRALAIISECAYHLKQHDVALEYATKCATLKPQYPMAYWLLAQYEADQENWKEALEWIYVSISKPDPQTLSVWDPSARERAILIAAQADFMLGNYNKALAWLRKIPKNPQADELYDHFKSEADAETFVSLLPKMRKFFANDQVLWEALCEDMKFNTALKPLRNLATTPKTWSDKSIVIFCGQGFEEWGPHTLDKGMGGSEEAIVYLAPELTKLGYDVTVYAEADLEQDGVHWRPWREIDTRDSFNIFVSWRQPQFLETITAKVKLADIHDVLPKEMIKNYPDVTYLFKSDYHKNLYCDVKSAVIGNGIKKEQFNQ